MKWALSVILAGAILQVAGIWDVAVWFTWAYTTAIISWYWGEL
jgi:hypothetical protein